MFADQPILTMKRTIGVRILLCLTLLPLGLLTGFGAFAAIATKPPDWLVAAMLGGVTVAFLALFGFLFWRETTRSTRLFTNGIERTQGSSTREMLWTEVTEVWFQATKVQAGGLVGLAISAAWDKARGNQNKPLDGKGTNIVVKLVGRSGETIKITSHDDGVMRAFEQVLQRVNPRLVEESMRRVQNGDTVRFGKLAISAQGIAAGSKEPIGRGEVERLDIQNGRLVLKKKGSWLSTATPVQKIPNVFVLTELYGRLFTEGPVAPPVVGRNLATRMFV